MEFIKKPPIGKKRNNLDERLRLEMQGDAANLETM
jgi:hypothetical protein